MAGCATLLHLAKLGWTDSVLIERDELTSGSTWHAAGQVTQFGAVQTMVGLKKYSVELYSQLAKDPDFPITYHIAGGIRLGHTQSDEDGYKHFIGMAKGMGVDFELLSPKEQREVHPLLNTVGLMGGLWDPLDGDIDPAQHTRAMARAAQALGAKVYRYTPCTGLRRNGDEWIVETPKGDIECEVIVSCTGYRVNQLGDMIGFEHPVASMEHQFVLTESIPEIEALDTRVPLIRDPLDDFYSRQEHDGLLVGIYEQECKSWGLNRQIDDNFTNALISPDLLRIADNMDRVMDRIPVLRDAGISQVINGPITYSGDGVPLVGRIPGVPNAYCLLGVRAGIGEGGGLGKMLAEIIIDGESEWDSWVLDPRRFTEYATERYVELKAIEEYQHEFIFHRPEEFRPAGRPAKTTTVYQRLKDKGAYYGFINGWERVMYYMPSDDHEHDPQFRHTTHFDSIGREAREVRSNVGIVDISGFTRYEISGPGAAEWLNWLSTGKLPNVGRIGLAYVCDEKGRMRSEFSVTRIAEDRFWLLSAAAAEWHDRDLLNDYKPNDVTITNRTATHTVLMVAGPNARKVLQKVTATSLENADFPWLSTREITIGMARVQALRVSFTGELGWELHVPMEHALAVYDELWAAGEEFGMIDFGLLATESMRIEKGYRGWKTDIITEYTLLESSLDRFVDFDKGDFLGRDALVAQKEAGLPKRFVPLLVDNDVAAPHAGDPIYAGNDIVGVVTSGTYGYTLETHIALGFVDTEHSTAGTELEVQVIGERCTALVTTEPMYDPKHERPRQ